MRDLLLRTSRGVELFSKRFSERGGKRFYVKKSWGMRPVRAGKRVEIPFPPTAKLLFAFSFIAGDKAVFDVDDAVGMLGNVGFVSHQHNRIAPFVQLGKERHDFRAGL